jgi:hypothetical protein
MRVRFVTLAAVLATLPPAAAFADQASPFVSPVSTVRPGEPLLCDFYYHEGDVIRRQDCRTKDQWNRLRLETQREISEFQIRSLVQH